LWQADAIRSELAAAAPTDTVVLADEDSTRLLDALTGYRMSADDPLTFQANLLSSQSLQFAQWATEEGMAVQLHGGNGIVIGHLSDETATAARADRLLSALRAFARQHRGNLVILNCDPAWKRDLPLFGDPEPAWPLMQRVKQALDPHNLLNPGRFLYGR
jgi:glycolate oxidase FAD binding subunit